MAKKQTCIYKLGQVSLTDFEVDIEVFRLLLRTLNEPGNMLKNDGMLDFLGVQVFFRSGNFDVEPPEESLLKAEKRGWDLKP